MRREDGVRFYTSSYEVVRKFCANYYWTRSNIYAPVIIRHLSIGITTVTVIKLII